MQPAIIEQVLHLERENRPDAALDRLFAYIDNLLSDGQFIEVDEILQDTNVSEISMDIILGIATITLAAKDELRNRESFMTKAVEESNKRQEDTKELFYGLC